MILCPNTTIYIGPPGCGKTTTLIRKVKQLLEAGVDPEKIGYISFTRQAIREAISRVISETGLRKDQFKFFKTVHSMAFALLGARVSEIINPYDLRIADTGENYPKEWVDLFSHLYNYHRVTGVDLEEVWELNHTEYYKGSRPEFFNWVREYEKYKAATNQMDFTDLLTEVKEQRPYMSFDWLFVDEGQDLTPAQWGVVELLAENTDNLVVAGDPDQTIYSWAGATSTVLDELVGEREILSQSYRVPRKTHVIAKRILGAMNRDILYRPRDFEGELHWCPPQEAYELDYNNGESWYILARNNFYLENISAKLFNSGIWFERLGAGHGEETNTRKHIRKIDLYNKYILSDSDVPPVKIRDVCSDPKACYQNKTVWWEAFDLWPIELIEFLRMTIDQWDKTKVHIGTFHSSKGGEADNVVLLGETTGNIDQKLRAGDIAELRALYVAVTRAKKNLYLVNSSKRSGIEWHSFINFPQDLTNGLL